MIIDDACPVPPEFIGRLYHSPQHGVSELVAGLSSARRGSLAAFCYGRAHLRDIGLAIAATCDLETLVEAGGRAGMFLFEQSRELPQEDKQRTGPRQVKVSLAPLSSAASLAGASLSAAASSVVPSDALTAD